MQIVIDIDEEDYKIMKHNIMVNNPLCPLSQEEMVFKVASGVPLPKGHGNLVDISELMDMLCLEDNTYNRFNNMAELITLEDIDRLNVIIEADKTENDGEE